MRHKSRPPSAGDKSSKTSSRRPSQYLCSPLSTDTLSVPSKQCVCLRHVSSQFPGFGATRVYWWSSAAKQRAHVECQLSAGDRLLTSTAGNHSRQDVNNRPRLGSAGMRVAARSVRQKENGPRRQQKEFDDKPAAVVAQVTRS